MKRTILITLTILIALLLALGIAFGVFTWVYFASEPQTITLPSSIVGYIETLNRQNVIGRIEEVQAGNPYDYMAFNGLAFHFYKLIPVGDRYTNGLNALFRSFSLGYTESLTPVDNLIGAALLTDIIPMLIGSISGVILSTLLSLLINKLKHKVIYLLIILGLLSTYTLLGLLIIHEVYSYVIAGVTVTLLPLQYRCRNKPIKSVLALLPISISVATLLLFPLGLLSTYQGLGSLLSPTSREQGAWLRAYAAGIFVLIVTLGIFASLVVRLWKRKDPECRVLPRK